MGAHGTKPVAQVEQTAGLDAGEIRVQGGLLGWWSGDSTQSHGSGTGTDRGSLSWIRGA